jgi:beta-glucosidase-like glycosyl hydrolase
MSGWNDFSSDKLSLRDKLAQLLFVRIGSNLPPVRTVEEDADRVTKLLEKYPLGGLLLFNGQRDYTPRTLERLQQISQLPLLIGADIERGVGQQIRGYTLFPHAMAFDALGDTAEENVFEFARLSGIAARAHGIHMSFSPVADVNIDPRNPIIATRAFGNDPQRVAQLVTAFVKGSTAGGILATAKHFPGHGNTHEDSHHALPTVNGTRPELKACELVPFSAAIAADIPLVMTAHVRFPALDPSGAPATLSYPILTDLLRGDLQFKGAVVSDSLLMDGVKSRFTDEGEMVLQTLLAGVDLQLDVADVGRVLDTLEQAVDDGRLPMTRVDEAFSRVATLKRRVFEDTQITPPSMISSIMSQAEELAKLVARQSVRVVASQKKLTPLSCENGLSVFMLRPNQSHLDPETLPLREFLQERHPQCSYHELGPSAAADDYAQAVEQALAAEQVVIAMVVKPAAWYRFGLLPEQDQFVRDVTAKRECILVSLGSPVTLEDYKDATERLCAYSDVFVSQAALADYLCGKGAR